MKHAWLGLVFLLAGCTESNESVALKEQNFTLGLVQKEISEGMDQPSVMEALGTPNFVTKDRAGNETWVYDKVATTVSRSGSTGGLLIGLVAGVGGGLGGGFGSREDVKTSQKTLTVVIKFNKDLQVCSTAYQSSRY